MAASAGGVEIVRLSARVLPDTSHLYDDLRASLAEIEARVNLNVNTSIDTTRLVEQARVAVDEAQAAAGNIDIKAKVDSSQIGEASRGFSGLSSSISGVILAAAALGPALIPLAAGLGAVAAALAGPLVLGIGGVSLFAFLTGAAIKQTEKQNKQITQLKASVDSARQALSNTSASAAASAKNSLTSAQQSAQQSIRSAQVAAATATTAAGQVAAAQRVQAAHAALNARQAAISASQSASVAAAQRTYNDALLKYRAALAGLTPAQEKFLEAQKGLSAAFHDLIVKVGPALLGPPTQALALMANVLPSLEPILRSFSLVFSDFLTTISDETKTKAFQHTISLFATAGATSFREFGNIVVNLAAAFGHFAEIFLPFGQSLMQTFVVASRGLEHFSASANAANGIKHFLDYVHTVGPLVTATLASLAEAVGHLVVALAPIGTVSLEAVKALADIINAIPTDALTALTASVVGLVVGLKLLGPALDAALAPLALSQPEFIAVVAGIAALAAGLVVLYRSSQPFRDVVANLGQYIQTTLLPPLEKAASQILPQFRIAIAEISQTIKNNQGFLEAFGKVILDIAALGALVGIAQLILSIRGIAFAFRAGTVAAHALADVMLAELVLMTKAVGLFVLTVLNQFGHIVDGAAKAFGFLPKVGGPILQAQKNFHDFENSVVGNLLGVSNHLADLKRQIDAVGADSPTIHIGLDDLEAQKKLAALQAFRLKDKTLTIQVEAELNRVVGPGGGIGHPTGVTPSGVTGNKISGGSSGGAAGINIQNATFTDARELRRQATSWLRGRAGGGVILNISPATGG